MSLACCRCRLRLASIAAALLLAAGAALLPAPAQAQKVTVSADVFGTPVTVTIQVGEAPPPAAMPEPGQGPPVPAALTTPPSTATGDGTLRRIGRTLPRFGGAYMRGTQLVLLGRRATAASVRAAATGTQQTAQAFADTYHVIPSSIVVKRSRYSFTALTRAKLRLSRALADTPGVVFIDADERVNRVAVGVLSRSARRRVRARARSLGLPRALLRIRSAKRAEQLADLQSGDVRPLGGTQLRGPKGTCTITVSGFSSRLQDWVALTNSHCTGVQYRADASSFSYSPFGSPLGQEALDPVNTADARRQSDAALIRLDPRAVSQLQFERYALPPIGSLSYLTLGTFSSTSSPYVGERVRKIGRTTGHTTGDVLRTCVQLGVLACQTITGLRADYGDSGSPVFSTRQAGGPLLGVLWGGSDPTLAVGDTYISPWSGITADLGAIQVCNHRYC